MKKLTLIILMTITIPVITYAQPKQDNPLYVIKSIKAYLYLDTKGVFSKEITDSSSLWNTIIGGGDAESPSHATMVVVNIKRMAQNKTGNRKIRLMATENGKIKLNQTIDFSLYDNNYDYYAAFWVYDTGCGRLKLSATVINEKTISNRKIQIIESEMKKEFNFECGE